MHDALGDALVVEMENLLAENEVFEQRGSTRASFQRILIVANPDALVGRQARVGCLLALRGLLMRLPTFADPRVSVARLCHLCSSPAPQTQRDDRAAGRGDSGTPSQRICMCLGVEGMRRRMERSNARGFIFLDPTHSHWSP
jgi:hypothetical protein